MKINLVETKMWCAAYNHNYMCHIRAKGFLDSNFNLALAVIDKISNFQEIAPNFTFSQKIVILKVLLEVDDHLLLPYKFCGKDI